MRYIPTCVIALALALPGCATVPANPQAPAETTVTRIATAVERASEAWALIKQTAALWLPRLSADRQAQINRALAIGDQAIATAQVASTVAEATQALAQVNTAAGQVTAATQ